MHNWRKDCGGMGVAANLEHLDREDVFGLPTKSVVNLVDNNVAFDYQTVSKYGHIMFVPKLLTF